MVYKWAKGVRLGGTPFKLNQVSEGIDASVKIVDELKTAVINHDLTKLYEMEKRNFKKPPSVDTPPPEQVD